MRNYKAKIENNFPIYSGVNNATHSSEFVRRELRTMVSERTMNNARPPQSPIAQNAMMTSNATVNNNINNNTNNVSMSMAAQQQQMTTNSMMNTSDIGYFDLPTSGKLIDQFIIELK